MKSQTAGRPDSQQPTRPSKSRKYARQTAHVEARRDGKPLIFGWGGHLSRNEKLRLQRRAIWTIAILFSAIIVTVLVGFWINLTVIVPNQPITSVNGQNIPQSDYRKLVAFKAQWELNTLKGLETQRTELSKQVAQEQSVIDTTKTEIDELNKQLESASGDKRTELEQKLQDAKTKQEAAQKKYEDLNAKYTSLQGEDIANQQARYTQTQLGSESVTWLQEDLLIRNWLNTQDAAIQDQVEPSESQIDQALKDFKNNLPGSGNSEEKYNQALSKYNISDSDMRTMLTLKLRRDNMNTYQRSLITSPTRQVQVSSITAATEKDAQDIQKQLQGKNVEEFAKVAKEKSQDNTTKENGGDLGWLMQGQYTLDYSAKISGKIDNWIFDPARKAGEVSPVLLDNGTYRVLRINAIEESRAVDAKKLEEMQKDSTPIDIWVQSQRDKNTITPADSTRQFDPANIPQDIPYSPPTPGAEQPVAS